MSVQRLLRLAVFALFAMLAFPFAAGAQVYLSGVVAWGATADGSTFTEPAEFDNIVGTNNSEVHINGQPRGTTFALNVGVNAFTFDQANALSLYFSNTGAAFSRPFASPPDLVVHGLTMPETPVVGAQVQTNGQFSGTVPWSGASTYTSGGFTVTVTQFNTEVNGFGSFTLTVASNTPYTVELQAADCSSGSLDANLVLTSAPSVSLATGGQFFLSYSSALTGTSITPGSGLQTVFQNINNSLHQATIAVGATALGQVLHQGDTLATIHFTDSATVCAQSGLVSFRTSDPPSRLTDAQANELTVVTSDLGALTINDTAAPVFNNGNPLPTVPHDADLGVCSWTGTLAAPPATDNCSLTLSATIGGDTYDWTLSHTFPVGTTTIAWTATDHCLNAASATQDVVVTDTQAPSISCPPDRSANADAGTCSAAASSLIGPNWTILGDASLALMPGTSNLAARLTALSTGTYQASYAGYRLPTPITFSNLNVLRAHYAMVQGCFGNGSPRFYVGLDTDGDDVYDGLIDISFGTPPSFDDCPPLNVLQDTGNFITMPDARWDTSAFIGGGPGQTHAQAEALLGAFNVTDVYIYVGSVPLVEQVIFIDDILVNTELQTFNTPVVSDNCDVASLTGVRSDGAALDAPYPSGPPVSILWTVTDVHGLSSTCTQTFTVAPFNTMQAYVEEAGLAAPCTRCVEFAFYTDSPCGLVTTVDVEIPFDAFGNGTVTFNVPCHDPAYTGLTCVDPKHTLRRTAVPGSDFVVNFTEYLTALTLEQGNVNNDAYIDILDFGVFIGKFQTPVGANTPCNAPGFFPDFSGDGIVGTEDFSFIQSGFLHFRDPDPCSIPLAELPVTDISVSDLVARGLRSYAMADFNLDGRLNAADVAWVAQNGLPRCSADFNDDQAVNVQDIFAYLNAWFMDHPKADMNANNRTDVQDIFTFLNTWFTGC